MLRPLDSSACKLKSFLPSVDICHLLITFTNRLDRDQDRQNIGPDLDSNCLALKELFVEKVNFVNKMYPDNNKSMKNYRAFK